MGDDAEDEDDPQAGGTNGGMSNEAAYTSAIRSTTLRKATAPASAKPSAPPQKW